MVEEEKKKRILELLEEMLKWIRVTNIPQVKKLLLGLLQSDEEKLAYHHSNGGSSRKVAKLAGVSHVDVTKWWKVWIRAGIAQPLSVQRGERARRIFALEDFGIEIPQPKEVNRGKKEDESIVTQAEQKTEEEKK